MKQIILYCALFICVQVIAQQSPNNTLYEWNRINYNPAFSGASKTTDLTLQTRQQWVGFEDAPRNQYVSVSGALQYGIGIGGVLYNNVSGPTRQTGITGAFAKHLEITKDITLSLSLSVSIYQNFYDVNKLHTALPEDPALVESKTGQNLAPDANFGALLFTDDYFIGLSSTNLSESHYDFFSTEKVFNNPIKRTYFFTAGYALYNEDITYVPSVLVKKTIGLPFQIDVSNRVNYKALIGGLSYRSSNDVSVLIGASFARFYQVVYSYDYSLGLIGDYSKGSHEIALRFRIDNPHQGSNFRKKPESFMWN